VTPLDEPSPWAADVVLSDGGTVHVRPIRPDDAERLVGLHGRLSSESIYYRFFSPKPRLTDKEVEKFTTVDMVDRAALVALLGDDIIGVGRYDRWPGKDEAEVAFTVDDAHQGRGISTLLLEHLAAVARHNHITRFTAEVLPDNRAMLTVFRKAGWKVTNEFSGGIVDVAFDIDPTPEYLETMQRRERRSEARSIARLLKPRTVAVVGASDRAGSVGRAVFRNLLAHGFDGRIYPVNKTAPHVASVPAYASVLEVPDDVHLAVLAVPADEVRQVVEECALKRVRGVVVFATGVGDADGEEQHALAELARRHGMRLVGPASMGIVTTGTDSTLYASFATAPVSPGPVAISLQSGPLGTPMLEVAARLGLGISTLVSLGDKADVSANDFLNYWDEDPDTEVVLLYTESFGNPRKFGRIARRVSRRKPIVAVKSGRRTKEDLAAEALYHQAGVIRVDTVQELFDTGRVLAGQPLPAGDRVAVVSNAASPARLALDGLVAADLRPAPLTGDTVAELLAIVPAQTTVGEYVDLTHRAVPADYRAVLTTVLHDHAVDAVLVVYAPPILDALEAVAATIEEVAAATDKPVVAVVLGRDDGPLVPGGRVSAFTFPEPAAAVLGRVARYAAWRARPEGVEPAFDDVDHDAVDRIVAHALEVRPTGTLLPVRVTADLLAAAGIRCGEARAVTSLEAAVAAAEEIGYPVALKAAGVARLARAESGGVALDVQDADELRGSYERMTAALGPAMAESVVQRMVPAGVETIVTVDSHPAFGPVVAFGLGGAFADAIGDQTNRALPLTDADVADLVAESRASGAMASLGADVVAVEELLLRVGLLVEQHPEIDRVRLNPVLVSAAGAWVVDAQVHVHPIADELYDVPVRRLG
jgi:acyl-CoA synthetase (NDP forming)/RimJ/RimL family protein N-acetyltransferase